ncbi:NAD-dependent epimerase/dehydratase family protein [Clostridium tarantellae]|uniref:NAD-dependent epimerase/dehydratase family protein n=1 Tax=Clostridium tarantellae TaxID=39493 RepID=A0A6I1MPR0_9CLOT|nr:NAD-dependent epimerase/dehydratase family protein [Clostridium tarantellae]MPQ44793.1 NAD-dependent epimerase/dehydratase family protein [Clostridium tarantellae]
MKVLVTGSNGFIGKNLVVKLKEKNNHQVISIDKESSKEELKKAVLESEFIFHLAGVNRTVNVKDFFSENSSLTQYITEILKVANKKTPILITSSIQAELENDYGKSKRLAEEALIEYRGNTGANVFIYRLPNVFGKWCKPNYNSVVATFCYNISRNKEIFISDVNKELTLVYIDDVVRCFIEAMETKNILSGFNRIDREYKVTLGNLADKIKTFKNIGSTKVMINLSDEFTKVLYSTYLSYLKEDLFLYNLEKKEDDRGWLAEIIKSKEFGQIFISKTKPGVTRGNHYHHTKVEKFIVLQGIAHINLRHILKGDIISYKVNEKDLSVIDIPPGYTHSITNVGEEELIVLFWANEIFNKDKPDTFFDKV